MKSETWSLDDVQAIFIKSMIRNLIKHNEEDLYINVFDNKKQVLELGYIAKRDRLYYKDVAKFEIICAFTLSELDPTSPRFQKQTCQPLLDWKEKYYIHFDVQCESKEDLMNRIKTFLDSSDEFTRISLKKNKYGGNILELQLDKKPLDQVVLIVSNLTANLFENSCSYQYLLSDKALDKVWSFTKPGVEEKRLKAVAKIESLESAENISYDYSNIDDFENVSEEELEMAEAR